jgi:hypothetical protein
MDDSYPKSDAPIPTDMQSALDRFKQEAMNAVGLLLNKLEQHQVEPIIHHYTTGDGLRGILESGKLWLTDVFALNDPSELRHGVGLASSVLDDKIKGESLPAVQRFAKDFRGFLQSNKFKEIANIFVCSFSKSEDDLGQWRSYADDGRGYNLGFETALLKRTFGDDKKMSHGMQVSDGELFQVTYNDSMLRSIYGEIVDKVLPLVMLPAGRELSKNMLGRVNTI